MTDQTSCPFHPGQKLQLKNNPMEVVEFTGKSFTMGKNTYIEVRTLTGVLKKMLADVVLPVDELSDDPMEQMARGCFGQIGDLKKLLTFEKLKGTLNEFIYSMEAAQVDFYPYQFKPVLKFIRSPTQRLILADEVGLGKTIEAGLIWTEMQARQQARRLLVICPPTLMDKWEAELRDKFLIDARQVDFKLFQKSVEDFERNGSSEEFALISSYAALRPPKNDLEVLRAAPGKKKEDTLSPRGRLLRKLQHWEDTDCFPFDMVIFDEAHYMRTSSTAAHMLGTTLCGAAQGVLFVSATPVNNKSADLHSLLSLVDKDFFASLASFDYLEEINKPSVHAAMALAALPVDYEKLHRCLEEMEYNSYVNTSPLFQQLKGNVARMEQMAKPTHELVAQTTELAEKLNILGTYINRTLRRQVEEQRPIRKPWVLTVDYTEKERAFYNNIEREIRSRIGRFSKFEAFALINRQLMAASCLPAYAVSLLTAKENDVQARYESLFESLFESFDMEDAEELAASTLMQQAWEGFSFHIPDPKTLAACDSKFAKLQEVIANFPGERIIIFACYHGTLNYLARRLNALGFATATISGRTKMEDRTREVARFTAGETKILLSSEVGSEGIDLQCAHVVVNYDMPWNPMRVEQRIGRIDRVGQTSPVLHIVNFSIADTIEDRVYTRLHEKLDVFRSTLGDIEAIIGKEIRQMTLDLFSSALTPEQQSRCIERTAQVLYNKMREITMLEEQSVELIGLSDYIQRKITEDHNMGHYIRSEELEDYVQDFFGRYFQGTLLQKDIPEPGCLRMRLSNEARDDLTRYMANDRSIMARTLRADPVNVTFDRRVMKSLPIAKQRRISFINHLSPLVRWITSWYRDKGHNLCRTSALEVSVSSLEEGIYVFTIQLWEISGITPYKKLSYGIRNLETGAMFTMYEGEKIFIEILDNCKDWPYQNDIPTDFIRQELNALNQKMDEDFFQEAEVFQAENETMKTIREERIKNIFLPRIQQLQDMLDSQEQEGAAENRKDMSSANLGRLKKAQANMDRQLAELEKKSVFNPVVSSIAMGIFYNSAGQ